MGSIAWGPVEHSFRSNVREQLAAVPQEMVLALRPELTNAWLVVEELAASIRSELEATAGTAAASEPAEGDQVEITMECGSVLKGQLDPAKVPFVSGYGTIDVATSAITSFIEGRLSLEDGSVLKGEFGDGDLAHKGALRIPAREIVAISRSGAPEPTAEQTLARRIEDWLVGLESRIAAHEAAPSGSTWIALLDHLSEGDKLGNKAAAEKLLPDHRNPASMQALQKRVQNAIYAPLRAAAEAEDWQTVELRADRILQINPRDDEARSLKDQAIATRAAVASLSAGTAGEPATKSVEKSETMGLAGSLSESEARRVIDQGVFTRGGQSKDRCHQDQALGIGHDLGSHAHQQMLAGATTG